jgi:hypothetical protein
LGDIIISRNTVKQKLVTFAPEQTGRGDNDQSGAIRAALASQENRRRYSLPETAGFGFRFKRRRRGEQVFLTETYRIFSELP